MSRSDGWSGKGRVDIPLWKRQVRKAKAIANGGSFSNGGLPRKRDKAKPISLPKLKFQGE